MTNILEYIKNIGFFLILVSVVCNALPENGFKKYCRLFCGLVLVILVLTPINELLNFDGNIGEIFKTESYDAELKSLEDKLKLQEQLEMDNALLQYEQGLADMLGDVASEQGLYILDVEVDYSYTEDGEDMVLEGVLFQVSDNMLLAEDENVDNEGYSTNNQIEEIHIEKIEKIDNIVITEHTLDENGQGDIFSDIDNLSHVDRPKVIKFIEEVSRRLNIDSTLVSIEWKE